MHIFQKKIDLTAAVICIPSISQWTLDHKNIYYMYITSVSLSRPGIPVQHELPLPPALGSKNHFLSIKVYDICKKITRSILPDFMKDFPLYPLLVELIKVYACTTGEDNRKTQRVYYCPFPSSPRRLSRE